MLRYNRCLTSATTNGILGNCAYPEQLVGLTGDDKFDLRLRDPVPQSGPDPGKWRTVDGLRVLVALDQEDLGKHRHEQQHAEDEPVLGAARKIRGGSKLLTATA